MMCVSVNVWSVWMHGCVCACVFLLRTYYFSRIKWNMYIYFMHMPAYHTFFQWLYEYHHRHIWYIPIAYEYSHPIEKITIIFRIHFPSICGHTTLKDICIMHILWHNSINLLMNNITNSGVKTIKLHPIMTYMMIEWRRGRQHYSILFSFT